MEQSRRSFLKLCGAVGAGIGLAALAGESAGLKSTAYAAQGPSGLSWEKIRKRYFTLSKDYIYMNNSTMGPTLKPVQERMAEVQKIFAEGCTLDGFIDNILCSLRPMRSKIGEIIGAPAKMTYDFCSGAMVTDYGRNIGNVDSVTEGMSLVANGLPLAKGDVIITTDHEHSGGRTMWELKSNRCEAVLNIVKLPIGKTGQAWVDAVVQDFTDAIGKVSPEKKVVLSFSWITTSTGHVLPAKTLCSLVAGRVGGGISVIDAAQAFTILPLNVQDIGCDFLVANGHKYLCGPIGSGFVYINSRFLTDTNSFYATVVDENYYFPNNAAKNYPHRKGGLAAYTNILPLYDALSFYQELGAVTVYNRLSDIGQWLRAGLSNLANVEVITPQDPAISCVMTCFRVPGKKSEDVYQSLKNTYGIQVKHSTEGDPDKDGDYLVRISPHYYNTQDEFVRLAKALCEIAGLSKRDYRSVFGDPPA